MFVDAIAYTSRKRRRPDLMSYIHPAFHSGSILGQCWRASDRYRAGTKYLVGDSNNNSICGEMGCWELNSS